MFLHSPGPPPHAHPQTQGPARTWRGRGLSVSPGPPAPPGFCPRYCRPPGTRPPIVSSAASRTGQTPVLRAALPTRGAPCSSVGTGSRGRSGRRPAGAVGSGAGRARALGLRVPRARAQLSGSRPAHPGPVPPAAVRGQQRGRGQPLPCPRGPREDPGPGAVQPSPAVTRPGCSRAQVSPGASWGRLWGPGGGGSSGHSRRPPTNQRAARPGPASCFLP